MAAEEDKITAIGYLGTHSTDYEVWSTDLVNNNAQAVFVMVYGSHFGNWDVSGRYYASRAGNTPNRPRMLHVWSTALVLSSHGAW